MPIDHFPQGKLTPLQMESGRRPSKLSQRQDAAEPNGHHSGLMIQPRLSLSRPQVNGAPSVRPIASKNMPLCFRENPNSIRKRNGNVMTSVDLEVAKDPSS